MNYRNTNINYENMIVDIKFFVIHDGNKGKLKDSQMDKLIVYLNEGFSGNSEHNVIDSKIRFNKKYVEYIDDAELYDECGNKEYKIVSTYRGDATQYLSIYSCDDEYLGFAYYPWTFPENNFRSVLFLNSHTFPEGSYKNLNLGATAILEISHAFGLKHTFTSNGKCDISRDDGISDTPLEKTPNYGCSLKRDTCPDDEGYDPIWNFMDYSPDICMNRFTNKQMERMISIISIYRKKLKVNQYKIIMKFMDLPKKPLFYLLIYLLLENQHYIQLQYLPHFLLIIQLNIQHRYLPQDKQHNFLPIRQHHFLLIILLYILLLHLQVFQVIYQLVCQQVFQLKNQLINQHLYMSFVM